MIVKWQDMIIASNYNILVTLFYKYMGHSDFMHYVF